MINAKIAKMGRLAIRGELHKKRRIIDHGNVMPPREDHPVDAVSD